MEISLKRKGIFFFTSDKKIVFCGLILLYIYSIIHLDTWPSRRTFTVYTG